MATIQVRVTDEDKNAAEHLFKSLGLDLTAAIRAFLKQSIIVRGLPFAVRDRLTENGFTPEFENEVLLAEHEEDGSVEFDDPKKAVAYLRSITKKRS